MRISAEKLVRIRELIRRLYGLPFSNALVHDAARTIGQVSNVQYFSLFLFANDGKSKKLVITNNPSDYIPVYFSVARKDFLMESLITTGREVVLRRMPDYDQSGHQGFIRVVQNARPISDVFYLPVKSKGVVDGFWSLARAGLKSPGFTDSDLELFRFMTAFLNDAFLRSLATPPLEEDVAHLDFQGHVLDAGARIKEAFDQLFGHGRASIPWKEQSAEYDAFLKQYRLFLHGPFRVGMDRLTIANERGRYSFLFTVIRRDGMAPLYDRLPHASVRLLDSPSKPVPKDSFDVATAARQYGLTTRECDVVRGIYQAKSNKEIAFSLGIDESTVKRHTHNIYEKTGLRSRVELVQELSGRFQNQLKL
jgi:DNA-binding CsgD family transcriptional regulator